MTDHRHFANLSGASDAQSPGSPIEWSTIQRILTHIEYQQHYQIIRLAVENLKELLEPNWTRFDASLRTIVSDILGETLDKARKVNNDEGLRKRKRIKELIPSALELLDMIQERQGGRDVKIKLPRGMLEHGLSFAGAGENGRRAGWIRRNVKLSERIYTGWDRLTEDEQLQIVRKIWDLEKKMEIPSQGGGTSSQLLNAKVFTPEFFLSDQSVDDRLKEASDWPSQVPEVGRHSRKARDGTEGRAEGSQQSGEASRHVTKAKYRRIQSAVPAQSGVSLSKSPSPFRPNTRRAASGATSGAAPHNSHQIHRRGTSMNTTSFAPFNQPGHPQPAPLPMQPPSYPPVPSSAFQPLVPSQLAPYHGYPAPAAGTYLGHPENYPYGSNPFANNPCPNFGNYGSTHYDPRQTYAGYPPYTPDAQPAGMRPPQHQSAPHSSTMPHPNAQAPFGSSPSNEDNPVWNFYPSHPPPQ